MQESPLSLSWAVPWVPGDQDAEEEQEARGPAQDSKAEPGLRRVECGFLLFLQQGSEKYEMPTKAFQIKY